MRSLISSQCDCKKGCTVRKFGSLYFDVEISVAPKHGVSRAK